MKNWYGYSGKILDVDLTSAGMSTAELDRALAQDYMGGKGFGARILYDQLPAGCDPLSPENILVFADRTADGHPGAFQRPLRGLHQKPGNRLVAGFELRRIFRA